jgi:OmpA-OmpF porin, OOP family
MKKCILIVMVFISASASAQLGNLLERAKQKTKDKVNQKVDQKMDKAIGNAIDSVDTNVSGKNKSKTGNNPPATAPNDESNDNSDGAKNKPGNKNVSTSLSTYSKFDFVPGEKIIVMEDFSQDAIGDFPDKWNTNSTGEIVTLSNQKGKWLKVMKEGVYHPEFITDLPDNFTLEFDIATNNDFNYYSYGMCVNLAKIASPKDFTDWSHFRQNTNNGFRLILHPLDAGANKGDFRYECYKDDKLELHNNGATAQFHAPTKNICHVAIWRQKQRIRVYLNEEKIFDLPRGMSIDKYNALIFSNGGLSGSGKSEDWYALSNLRLAIGAANTRSKLITEGKFVTRGILFDSNSDNIKPESYGALKDIAAVLNENMDVKIKIIGHTDADGDDKANLDLSKRRAEAVKNTLAKDFGIAADRITTDGKGESQPTDANTTAAGKANNRRVEFIKL